MWCAKYACAGFLQVHHTPVLMLQSRGSLSPACLANCCSQLPAVATSSTRLVQLTIAGHQDLPLMVNSDCCRLYLQTLGRKAQLCLDLKLLLLSQDTIDHPDVSHACMTFITFVTRQSLHELEPSPSLPLTVHVRTCLSQHLQ
jgi:hypothetical protein